MSEFRMCRLSGVIEIIPKVFFDDRGYFFESYSGKDFEDYGLELSFVQDNQSFSKKGVLRGFHFQRKPYEQGKLIRVISGKILDVVVDLRKDSPTFGQSERFVIDSDQKNMVYIPEGFSHAFYAIEDTILTYKCTNEYRPDAECGIIWNDPDLGIQWPDSAPVLSGKDKELKTFKEIMPLL